MLGQGFAFALLPVLRHVYAHDPDGLDRAVQRHAGYFNAHPYLAELALGAVVRMEVDGVDPETIRRFKSAVRGPLGGLGDRLVWVGILPVAVLVGLVAFLAGGPVWLPPLAFLAVYNAGHLTLRIWAYRAGLREGVGVADRIRDAALPGLADRLASSGSLVLGLLFGLLVFRLVAGGGDGRMAALALAGVAGAFTFGVWRGQETWRMAAGLIIVLVGGAAAFGVLS